jgi:hypothetical protein
MHPVVLIQFIILVLPDDGLDKPKHVVTSNKINYRRNNRSVLTVTRIININLKPTGRHEIREFISFHLFIISQIQLHGKAPMDIEIFNISKQDVYNSVKSKIHGVKVKFYLNYSSVT